MTISRRVELKIKNITPSELAAEFCEWDGDNQSLFFHYIWAESSKWSKPLEFQLQAIIDSALITDNAILVMRKIGDYAKGGKS